MEKAVLKNYIDSGGYIPPKKTSVMKSELPKYHPSLIVEDKQTDVTKLKRCGCSGTHCVKNAPEWIPRAKH
ncbi:hypothetical protein KGF56_001493 [Candida oxycetoniae]|uniref:Uncharacterized protein n=1 Tax=Candida oxycetoniae TaxID=497107 RepID=A0AAI9SZY1_9ASCO|nr:uncharacterized protein KGF56_001493 [Candida oxycetoniae]KAI3405885.2 hypothetical protein KGF56_001493 [Candida oxycetoniae]